MEALEREVERKSLEQQLARWKRLVNDRAIATFDHNAKIQKSIENAERRLVELK